MSDSISLLDQIDRQAVASDVLANELFAAASPATAYGYRASASAGLTWAYYGCRNGGVAIPNGALTLTASSTCFIVASRSTGAVSSSTSNTNWNNASGYARLYKAATSSTAVTSWEDHRFGASGIFGSAVASLTDGDYGDIVISSGGAAMGIKAALLTAYGRTLTAAANAAAARTVLGVAQADLKPTHCIPIAASDETTALVTGSAKVTFRMPYAFTLSSVRASLTTAQASGSLLTVDIKMGGTSVLTTKITIDNTAKTSKTAATPPVIGTSALTDDAEITIDITQIGDGTAKGLKVYLIGSRT